MERLTAELFREIFPEATFTDSDFDLLNEAVMFYHGLYKKATILISSGQREVEEEEKEIIFAKESRLDYLNQFLQTYREAL